MFFRRVISYSILFLVPILILSGIEVFPSGSFEDRLVNHIARENNIALASLEIGAFDPINFPLLGISLYQVKVINQDTGHIYSIVVDDSGTSWDREDAFNAEREAYLALYGKLDPALYELLEEITSDETVRVAIWLNGNGLAPFERLDIAIQQAAVGEGDMDNALSEMHTHGDDSSVEKSDERQLQVHENRAEIIRADQAEQRELIEAFQKTNVDHLKEEVAKLQAPILAYLSAQGYETRYVSPIAPLIYVELPKTAIDSIAQRQDVDTIYGPNENYDLMDSAKTTQKGDIVDTWGFEGSGIDLAILEDSRIQFSNPYLNSGITRVPTDPNIDDHAAGTAGIVASQHDTYQGIAQGVNLFSANATTYDDANLSEAMDWAAGRQNVDIINNSWGGNADTTTLNVHDRHLDYIVRNLGSTITVAAGNEADGCGAQNNRVTSPARGYNVISVGNYADDDSFTWSGDAMDICSSYTDPSTGVEKPEVAAVGNSISSTTASSPWIADIGSGTSYAAPMIAGEAALIMERESNLITRPEAVKAIIMASALHNIEGDSTLSERDGAGGVDMRAAFHLVDEDWWAWTQAVSGDFPLKHHVYVSAGDTVRAAIAWDSNPDTNYTTTPLEADIDLSVFDPDGSWVTSSASTSNSFEIIEFTPSKTGLYEFRISASSFNGSMEYIGFAFWQPERALNAYEPQTGSTPPISNHYYRFTPGNFWNGVAIRSPNGGDYDIALYDSSAFSNPAGRDWLEASTTEDTVDYIVLDVNHAPMGNYFPEVAQLSGGGNYVIELASQSDEVIDLDGVYGPYSMTPSQIIYVWDTVFSNGIRKYFAVNPESGNADLGIALHDTNPASPSSWYQGASQSVVAADSLVAGGDEFISYETSTSDNLGLVVWNNGASSTTTFYLFVDTNAPSGSISLNGGAGYSDSTAVTLDLVASDPQTGVSGMRFNNGSGWTAWEAFTTDKSWTLPEGDGSKTVYAQFRNNAGMISATYEDSIALDTLPPVGSIQIDNGSPATSATTVSLSLSASDAGSGVVDMRLMNEGASWTGWETYKESKIWTLSPGNGTKTVYVQYRDGLGRISPSYSDDIILDTTPPSGSILIEDGAIFTGSTWVTLTLAATDSPAGVAEMHFSSDAVNWSTWEPYTGTKNWILNAGDGSKIVYVEYRDNAGNISMPYNDSITLDTTVPEGSIQINNGDSYSSTRNVELVLSASDGLSGVADMRFSNNASSWSSWENYTNYRSWTLTSGDGTKTVYVQYRDHAGNSSASYSDNILLDTTGPTGTISINNGAAYTTSASVELNLSAADSGTGVSKMRFLNQGLSWSDWESYNSKISWTLTSKDGTKKVYVQFQDNAGNISATFNDTIIKDTIAPSGSILIQSGDEATNTRSVTLDLSASDLGSGLDDMRFSNNSTTWSGWEKYASSKSWSLSAGDGTKTVFVQYRDKAGFVSSAYSDEIILDTVAPTSQAISPATSLSRSFLVSWAGSDLLSGVESYDVQFRVGAGGSWTDWLLGASFTSESFGPASPVSLVRGETYYFRVRARDVAGNIESYPTTPDSSTYLEQAVELFLPLLMR